MEVVSGLASSAQLLTYVVKAAAFLSDLYESLKNAPDRIRQDANHVKRLIEIILHIKETRSLHTTLVCTQLEHTISQACSLRDLLVKVLGQYTHPSFRSRYWKVLKDKREKQILLALKNLEREKTGLSLCLTAAQTEFLHEVRDEVRKAEPDMPEQGAPKLPQGQIIGGQCPVRNISHSLSYCPHTTKLTIILNGSHLQQPVTQTPSKFQATKYETWKALTRRGWTPSMSRRKRRKDWEILTSR
jgi:hypothetical protein